MLRRRNCLFTAASKSVLAFPALLHPYECGAGCGCLAAAVLHLIPLFVCFTDGQQCQLHLEMCDNGRRCRREALTATPNFSYSSVATRCTCVLTCSHLHVSRQGADPPLASSAGQEDGDDSQQGADSQQSTASRTQYSTGLREHTHTHTQRTCELATFLHGH